MIPRERHIVIRPDGALFDVAAADRFLGAIDRRHLANGPASRPAADDSAGLGADCGDGRPSPEAPDKAALVAPAGIPFPAGADPAP